MPFLQVHTSRDVAPATKRALGKALAAAYGETMQTTRHIVNVGFVRYAEGDLARYDGPDDEPREMTVITCDGRDGRTPDRHESLGRALASACAQALGIAEARIAVYITEHPSYQIYRDGGRAPEWSP